MFNKKKKMPILFVGHGSPMNAIEDNKYTEGWENIVKEIPKPKAILAISAHWYTHGTRITDSEQPKMVYDMYGFPEELYEIVYGAKGSPELAHKVKESIGDFTQIDNTWGIDHGAWSVLHRMYPKADIPVLQLSVNADLSAEEHFEIGKKLNTLREEGVLIFGSGNVVHNLPMVEWDMEEKGFGWAEEFDNYIKQNILKKDYKKVINYELAGESANLSFQTPDHYYPLLYILGASDENDKITVFNDSCTMGSLSMTSYLFN